MTTANAKLYGIKITRTKLKATHTVWSGYRPQDCDEHERIIRAECYAPEHDGELLFERVESDVVVTGPGLYQTKDMDGQPFRVVEVKDDGSCYGWTQGKTPKGQWKDRTLSWFWVNGTHFDRNRQARLTGPFQPPAAITLRNKP